ncbi:Lacal_2735 family protein [bacterium]|nr:Lacal_2735 family protein [bacterium]
MFGLFKKKSEKEKLQEQYKKLLEQSFEQSTIDRKKSDQLQAEAEEVMKMIERIKA